MKLNKQKIDAIKLKVKNIRNKISNSNKEKVPKKYYVLLILMLILGFVTLSSNVKQYNDSNLEDFKEYTLEGTEVSKNDVEVINYITDISSISTNIPNDYSNEDYEAIETISNNDDKSYIMPLDGEVIKEYAVEKLVYSETLGMWKTHPGIDIKAKLGDNVKSAGDGIVQLVAQDSFYGNTIQILDNKGYIFVYSNLDNNIILHKGDNIKKGEIVGKVGVSASGELADECHLHFEIIKDEKQVNPLDLVN